MKGHGIIESTLRGFARALAHSLNAEELARKRGLLQALDPRARLLGVLALVLAVTLSRKLPVVVALFAVALSIALASRVSPSVLATRVWLVVLGFTGFIALPAIFLTPGTAVFHIGPAAITSTGLRTAILLLARVETAATLTATLVLCTPWASILKALRALHVPAEAVTMLAMTYRYIFLLIETANHMFESRQSRILGQLGGREQRRLAARTAAVLLSKSIDLSSDVYLAMQARGFQGNVRLLDDFHLRPADCASLACFFLAAVVAVWIGR
jgi:cobalt ECF transporter T component CbiQ